MDKLFKSKAFKISFFGLGTLAMLAILAPWISPKDPDLIDVSRRLLPPGWGALLGTDALGRDLLSRMMYGARISMGVAALAVPMMTLIGISFGILAGHFRGWVDMGVMRGIDILLCIPMYFLVLILMAMLGPGIKNMIIVIVLTGWTDTARLVRAEILSLREREYILSARASGASAWRLMFKHLLPNAMAPVYVTATFGVAGVILMESALSFLGLGVQDPTSSWGSILDGGRQYIGSAWWLTVFPGVAILGTLLLVNGLGESLRSHFDAKGKTRG